MADIREVLKGLGVDDATLDAITSKIPAEKKLHILEDGQFVPKSRFDEVNEQKNSYKKQAEELNAQVSELGKFKGTAEELQKKLGETQAQYEQRLVEQEKSFTQKRLNFELDTAITINKGKNAKAIKALIDQTAIKVDGDSIQGISEQLEIVKKDNPYLFDIEQQTPPPNQVGRQQGAPNVDLNEDEKLRKAFGLPPKK